MHIPEASESLLGHLMEFRYILIDQERDISDDTRFFG